MTNLTALYFSENEIKTMLELLNAEIKNIEEFKYNKFADVDKINQQVDFLQKLILKLNKGECE